MDTSKAVVPDEVFNLTTFESTICNSSLMRYDCALIQLGDTIFALGGRDTNGAEVFTIESFDIITSSWKPHSHSLESKDTATLAVTALPRSAVDCNPACQCGVQRRARINNGQEVKHYKL